VNDYEFEEALYIYNEHCAKDVQRIDISKYVSDHDLPITKFLPYAKLEDKKMIINLPFKLEHSFEKEFKFIVDKPDIAIGTPNLCYWYENYYYRFWSLNDDSATKKPTLILERDNQKLNGIYKDNEKEYALKGFIGKYGNFTLEKDPDGEKTETFGVCLSGANVHDMKRLTETIESMVIERPA